MRLDRNIPCIFSVERHYNGRWKVTENGMEGPLAFFDRLEYAKNYAKGIASTKKGSKILIDGRP